MYHPIALQWRHNEHDGVSKYQPHDCLFNRLFRRRSKKTSKFRVTGLCEGNSPVTGEFPAQRASNAEKFPFDDVIMGSRWLENTIQIPPWDCFTSIIQDDIIIVSSHYSDVIISTMASQVTGVTIVCSSASLGLVQIKEYTKALRHWPLWMESTSNAENVSIWWCLHENGNLHMLWYSMTPWLYVYDIFMVELVSALNKANSYVHMHA